MNITTFLAEKKCPLSRGMWLHCTRDRKHEPQCHKIYLSTCALGKNSDQPAHLHSLTRIITKTCLYNFDPFKPHFYIVKPGFTGVYTSFLISAQKHRLWVLIRTASLRWFQLVPTIYVLSRNMKKISEFFYVKIFRFSLQKHAYSNI